MRERLTHLTPVRALAECRVTPLRHSLGNPAKALRGVRPLFGQIRASVSLRRRSSDTERFARSAI